MFQEDAEPAIAKLVATKDNPVPGEPRTGMVEVEVGVFLRYALWRTPGPSSGRGTAIVLQGRTEYIEKTFETVSDLLARGFDVLTFDWRGQGGSTRLLENQDAGYIDSFDDYVTDLRQILLRVALPDCRAPFNILAHSTGSLVALMAAPFIANNIDRMVFCSPLFGLDHRLASQGTIHFFAGLLTAFGLGNIRLSKRGNQEIRRSFENNMFTHDEVRFRRNTDFAVENPHIVIGSPTASWVHAACRAMDQVHETEFLRSVDVPVLAINAGNDSVVDNVASESLVGRLRVGSALTIAGAYHELWQEKDVYREQFLAATDAFLSPRTTD